MEIFLPAAENKARQMCDTQIHHFEETSRRLATTVSMGRQRSCDRGSRMSNLVAYNAKSEQAADSVLNCFKRAVGQEVNLLDLEFRDGGVPQTE